MGRGRTSSSRGRQETRLKTRSIAKKDPKSRKAFFKNESLKDKRKELKSDGKTHKERVEMGLKRKKQREDDTKSYLSRAQIEKEWKEWDDNWMIEMQKRRYTNLIGEKDGHKYFGSEHMELRLRSEKKNQEEKKKKAIRFGMMNKNVRDAIEKNDGKALTRKQRRNIKKLAFITANKSIKRQAADDNKNKSNHKKMRKK